MVHGLALMAHASRLVAHGQEKIGARARDPGDQAFSLAMSLESQAWGMSHEPWAMHDPWTINHW